MSNVDTPTVVRSVAVLDGWLVGEVANTKLSATCMAGMVCKQAVAQDPKRGDAKRDCSQWDLNPRLRRE